VIVVGEAPLAGALLESALCGIELGIPVVIIDNAYNPFFVEVFCQVHGPMVDGILLTGPSSHYLPNPPSFLRQVPPFIESTPEAAKEFLLAEIGVAPETLVTILAYDEKVEQLGISLLKKLDRPDVHFLFCSKHPEALKEAFGQLPEETKQRAWVIGQPPEPILFGLLERSKLAVVKYGFMQVSECLALQTPVIVVFHEGPTWLESLPEASQQFTWVTTHPEADYETVEAAARFLSLDPGAMNEIHTDGFGAAADAAAFLEEIPLKPRSGTEAECELLGFTQAAILPALRQWFPDSELSLHLLRATRLRITPEYQLYSVVCGFSANGSKQFARMWGRLYGSPQAAFADIQAATQPGSGRRPLYSSPEECILLEDDNGEAELPPLNP
jgi:hypothetical protein